MRIGKKTEHLYEAILSLETINECKLFFRDLLTEAEIKEFSNRWHVVTMLEEKESYEKITKTTGMSSTTIARISKWLNGNLGGYRLVLQKMKQQTNKQNKNAHHTSH